MTETTTAPEQEVTLTLALSIPDLNIIIAALQELPHRAVDQLIKDIVAQAQSQLAAAEPAQQSE